MGTAQRLGLIPSPQAHLRQHPRMASPTGHSPHCFAARCAREPCCRDRLEVSGRHSPAANQFHSPLSTACFTPCVDLLVYADCDSPKSLLLCEVLAACERYHGLSPFSVASNVSPLGMVSDLLDALVCEVRPVPSNDGSDVTATDIDEMPPLAFPDDSQQDDEETCQFCGTESFMAENKQTCCRRQMHFSIFGDSEDVEDEYEDNERPMSPRIARTKPKRHASMSTLINIRKSLWAENDVASITPTHEPKRRKVR